MRCVRSWAEEEFGQAELGDARRTSRLVAFAAAVAARPAGTVTKALSSSAAREGAFRLLENTAVRPDSVRAAVVGATGHRCAALGRVIVPIDATSLKVTDERAAKGLGAVGTTTNGARGVHAMTALAVTPQGASLGMCAQILWVRDETRRKRANPDDSEARFWVEAMAASNATFEKYAPDCQPWYQIDRGGDCNRVLVKAVDEQALLTVRAQYDRHLDDENKHLWPCLQRSPVIAKRQLQLPTRPPARKRHWVRGRRLQFFVPRPGRTARVEIRAARVTLVLKEPGQTRRLEINAVFVKEIGYRGADALDWMLLTTHPIQTRKDVLAVIDAYTLRWRIEDFHRAWKRGLCRVEDTQLRSRDAIFKWATILATVATRAMRLAHLARTTPDVPASTEFGAFEIEAIMALRQPKLGDDRPPTLLQAVRWVAEIGGHVGPWAGLPGATTIGRGLHDVLVTARAFAYRAKKKR
jgi:Transposase DNA-binding/Transposase DDE domain